MSRYADTDYGADRARPRGRTSSGDVFSRLGGSGQGESSAQRDGTHARHRSGGGFSTRGRGGISKHSLPGRPEHNLTPYSSAPDGGPRRSYNRSKTFNTLAQEGTPRLVTNWSGASKTATEQTFLDFIRSKVRSPITIINSVYMGDTATLTVEKPAHAIVLKSLSGIYFQGIKLFISIGQSGPPPDDSGSQTAIQKLTELINSRYDSANRYLNLDNITDQLKAIGQPDLSESSKLGPVLCKLFEQICPEVESISLAGNDIKTLQPFSTLPTRLPNLANLSFQNNKLFSYQNIDVLPGSQLRNLKHLILLGNPIRDKLLSRPGGDLTYKSDIKKIFPSLEFLDNEQLVGEIRFDVGEEDTMESDLPFKSCKGFMDSLGTSNVVQDFLPKFFSAFDSHRSELSNVYDNNALFSVSVNNHYPPTSKAFGSRAGGSGTEYFDTWWTFNRNLQRSKTTDKRIPLLYQGTERIMCALNSLPATRHPLDDTSKFVADAFQIAGPNGVPMLFIQVHGEFCEINPRDNKAGRNRSFDRTLYLVPSTPGSRPHQAGVPYAIINDLLVVRCCTGNKAWANATDYADTTTTPKPAPTLQTSTPNSAPAGPMQSQGQNPVPAELAHLNPQQLEMVYEISSRTHLNYAYSLQCLSDCGWQMTTALEAFHRHKSNIPSDAYIQ
ncbi:uncharacterized protein BJ171DRAFT_580486 [Polychytrium aggregatum]|uniref:uncharacterized protein n=1 Tax=Polychytrium aggregatum TaxID=110093 RepID=UPI0022FE3C4C|nr:uncharacterized protein BJ171DRAFT_580486 [Polychytrium aggregatum]KAI9205836.1 hypothetical protein BJ171DRAFT_580486 [Polychytrium aggregatum]